MNGRYGSHANRYAPSEIGFGFHVCKTTICALGHLNYSMVPGIFMSFDWVGHR